MKKMEEQGVLEQGQDSDYPNSLPVRKPRDRKGAIRCPNVCILDDHKEEVDAIQAILAEEKFVCTTFTHPRDCIEHVKKVGCDILLCDLRMPEMDGQEVLMETRSIRPDLPVVMITGYGTINNAVTATKSGAVDFIEKPFDKDVLIKAIRDALRDSRPFAELPVKLSSKELLILRHVLRGNGNRHIAQKIGKSVRTVEDHRRNLMKKMGVDNLVDLVKRAIALGFDGGVSGQSQ
jgi:two-component system, LuxR family, response regulator FixJ